MSEPTIRGGYIMVSRQLLDSGVWELPPVHLKAWLYLLLKANHSEQKNGERLGFHRRANVIEPLMGRHEDVLFYVQRVLEELGEPASETLPDRIVPAGE